MEERASGREPHADGEEEDDGEGRGRGRGRGGGGALCKINPRALLARNRGST